MNNGIYSFKLPFFVSEIFEFFCVMQISKLMTSSVVPLEDGSQNQEYLSKCNSDMIQTWHE